MAGRAGERRAVAVTADGTLGHEIGVSEERMSFEESDPREVPMCLGAAAQAVQRVLQAALDLGATEDGAELHLRRR